MTPREGSLVPSDNAVTVQKRSLKLCDSGHSLGEFWPSRLKV